MANKYDAYREALVMEEATIWPQEFEHIDPVERARLARLLHDAPQEAAELDYLRSHTGFCRQIAVTAADLERLGAAP